MFGGLWRLHLHLHLIWPCAAGVYCDCLWKVWLPLPFNLLTVFAFVVFSCCCVLVGRTLPLWLPSTSTPSASWSSDHGVRHFLHDMTMHFLHSVCWHLPARIWAKKKLAHAPTHTHQRGAFAIAPRSSEWNARLTLCSLHARKQPWWGET